MPKTLCRWIFELYKVYEYVSTIVSKFKPSIIPRLLNQTVHDWRKFIIELRIIAVND